MKVIKAGLKFAVLLSAGWAAVAHAGTIGPNCGSCSGSIYTLTYNPTPVKVTSTYDLWQITLTIDTTGFNGGGKNSSNDFLSDVSIKIASKIASGAGVTAASLVSFNETAPSNPSLSGANWSDPASGGMSANGCSGSGGGWICDSYVPTKNLPGAPVTGVYTWVFDVPVAIGALFTGSTEASIKARYVNAAGNKVGSLVSENIALTPSPLVPTPEPISLLALLTVIAGLSLRAGKTRRL